MTHYQFIKELAIGAEKDLNRGRDPFLGYLLRIIVAHCTERLGPSPPRTLIGWNGRRIPPRPRSKHKEEAR